MIPGPEDPEAELLTPAEVARELRVHRRTVYRWIKAGQLRTVKVGRLLRIYRGDVTTYLGAPRQGPTT
jgi:excisionase family DNA binding protein